MPELPEVETVKKGLEKSILKKKVAGFDCDTPKMLNHPLAFYRRTLKGLCVKKIARRAKMIIVDLDKDWRLLAHLKMTGQLVFVGKHKCVIGGHPIKEGFQCAPNKFTHAAFTFSDNTHLYFNDVRKFGWLRLYRQDDLRRHLAAMGLGPEPLDKNFTLEVFQWELKKRPKTKIKQFLLDPKNVVGIGNIYSDEICFYARVRPNRQVKSLTEKEIKLLFKGIKKILAEAIRYEGTSISDYVNVAGEAGAYTKKLKIYQRYGLRCLRCKGKVEKMKLGGRTSSYCPSCQK